MTIAPVYAGLLTLLFVALGLRVIAMRRSAHVGLDDGGNRVLLRRMRVQANFAEYVPLGLLPIARARAGLITASEPVKESWTTVLACFETAAVAASSA